MSESKVHILLVALSPDYTGTIRGLLIDALMPAFQLEWLPSLRSGMERLDRSKVDVVLLDLSLPDCAGLGGFIELRSHAPQVPIIVLSDVDDDLMAVQAVHEGAQDYLVKGRMNGHLLTRSILYAIERKRTEAALVSVQAKYRKIFENTIEGIFQTSPDGQYLEANRALARIYGYGTAEELMSNLTNIARDLYVDNHRREEFISLMGSQDFVSGFESQIRRKDDKIIWISENVRVVRNGTGQVVFYEGTVEDITVKKQAELDLLNSEKLYHSLVETLPQNIFRKNLLEQFTFANKRFCETLGKPLAEIIGKTDFDFFPPEMAAQYQRDDQEILKSGRMFETIEENQPPGMDRIYVNVVKTPLYSATGEIMGLQGIFWDITRRRRAEEGLKKANLDLARSQEELTAKNNQMTDDLRMAREIQLAILPQQYPLFPKSASRETSVLKFSHRYIPSGEVGGDFFNVLALSETKAGVFICDVMGHGVRSALVTAIVRALVEELTRFAADPGELLGRINHDLRAILKQCGTPLYTTAFYMVVDIETRQLWYSNAGHPKPLIAHRKTGAVDYLENDSGKNQPALGLFGDINFVTTKRSFSPDDLIVLFTDGVYDVELDGQLLSPDWLHDQLKTRMQSPVAEIFDQILDQLKRGQGGEEFEDDMCLLGMEISACLPEPSGSGTS